MYKYYYTREIVDGNYNIDNPNRVDGEGNKVLLADDVETLFPTYQFRIYCGEGNVTIAFLGNELTNGEKIDLDTCVYNHKNNL
jgi:hypothetical protein